MSRIISVGVPSVYFDLRHTINDVLHINERRRRDIWEENCEDLSLRNSAFLDRRFKLTLYYTQKNTLLTVLG